MSGGTGGSEGEGGSAGSSGGGLDVRAVDSSRQYVQVGTNVMPCCVYGSIDAPWKALYRRGFSFSPSASLVSKSTLTLTHAPTGQPPKGCNRTSKMPSRM